MACLEEYHPRSGRDVHFFFGGWSKYVPAYLRAADTIEYPSTPRDLTPWCYSADDLNSLINEIETISKYKWSGASELLLISSFRETKNEQPELDFRYCLSFNVDQMLADRAVDTVGELLERICREGKRRGKSANINHLSDAAGAKIVASTMMEGLLDLLPGRPGRAFRKAKHFAVKDLSL